MNKRYNKIIKIVVFILLYSSLVFPKTVDFRHARMIANNWYAEKAGNTKKANFDNEIDNQYKNHISYYIFAYYDGGFVIVAGDDSVVPILGYSTDSKFDENDIPIQLQEWLLSYDQQIDEAINNDKSNSQTLPMWDEIANFDSSPGRTYFDSSSESTISPLITTTWSQGKYYNTLCPADAGGSDGHAVVGCVATAMGQAMKYWNYPTIGTGSHSYVHPTYGTLSANFGATTYGWASMPDPGGASSYNTSLATLLYHCGVSVNMNYGPSASGASTAQVATSLQTYFGYASSCQYISRSSYTESGWNNILIAELDAGRPMQYRGSGAAGGHSFNCDGYQSTDYFHFNWGWGGYADGYFYLSNLNPGSYTFTDGQAAIIGIQPGSSNPIIGLNPPSLTFYATQNGPLPSNQTFNVSNVGAGTLNWTASEGAGWLSMTPLSGTNSGTVTVSVTTTNKALGTYNENASVSGNSSNSPQTMPIYYNVSAPWTRTNTNLIVPDYGTFYDATSYYTSACDANGHTYDVWNGAVSPTAADLNQYVGDGCVIWYTSADWSTTLDANERSAIQTYLGNGGSLFFTGQDLGYYSYFTGDYTWYNSHFYSTYVADDVGLYGVIGVGSDPITNGLNLGLSSTFWGGSSWFPSEIDPISPAGAIFTYDPSATVSNATQIDNQVNEIVSNKPTDDSSSLDMGITSSGTAGIKVDNGTYKLVYLAFSFETIANAQDRATLMDNVLNWLNPQLDPGCTNGAIIYNTETGKFNFCEDGVWVEK